MDSAKDFMSHCFLQDFIALLMCACDFEQFGFHLTVGSLEMRMRPAPLCHMLLSIPM